MTARIAGSNASIQPHHLKRKDARKREARILGMVV